MGRDVGNVAKIGDDFFVESLGFASDLLRVEHALVNAVTFVFIGESCGLFHKLAVLVIALIMDLAWSLESVGANNLRGFFLQVLSKRHTGQPPCLAALGVCINALEKGVTTPSDEIVETEAQARRPPDRPHGDSPAS